MIQGNIYCRAFIGFGILCAPAASLASPAAFKRLSTPEIRKAFVGWEFTDEIHWFYRFKPDGRIEGASMGRRVTQTWVVRDGKLCIAANKGDEDCREVWRKDNQIELRRYADDPVPDAGILRR